MINREIKFRAWNEEKRKMYYDVQNAYDNCLDYDNINAVSFGGILEIYPVMQYAGFKDYNGREVYEGDIVQYYVCENDYEPTSYQTVGIVGFKDGEFYPRPYEQTIEDGWYSHGIKDLIVIGNIHENPDLIK